MVLTHNSWFLGSQTSYKTQSNVLKLYLTYSAAPKPGMVPQYKLYRISSKPFNLYLPHLWDDRQATDKFRISLSAGAVPVGLETLSPRPSSPAPHSALRSAQEPAVWLNIRKT